MTDSPIEHSLNRYVAFFRGINVGGHKLVKMEILRQLFVELGFSGVQTLLASGNVLFQTSEKDRGILTQKVEKEFEKVLSFQSSVILRTHHEIADIASHNPFSEVELPNGTKVYVSFLAEEPHADLKRTFSSYSNELEMFHMRDRELYALCHNYSFRSRFSNIFVEKELKVVATTRDMNTVRKLAAL